MGPKMYYVCIKGIYVLTTFSLQKATEYLENYILEIITLHNYTYTYLPRAGEPFKRFEAFYNGQKVITAKICVF